MKSKIGRRELGLTVLAILSCGVSAQYLVFGTLGIIPFNIYRDLLLIPSVVIVFAIAAYASSAERRLANRLMIGLVSGFTATFALELFRIPGYAVMHWLPGDDMISFPGVLLTNVAANMMQAMPYMALKEPAPLPALLAGGLWHFWNGATFGAVYALLVGRGRWWYGAIWGGAIIETGMMYAPWLVMMMGPFGVMYLAGYNIFVISLIAHIAFGIVLGVMVRRLVKEEGSMFSLLFASHRIHSLKESSNLSNP